jgi:NADH dehydrogenase
MTNHNPPPQPGAHRVVVIGGGFGGVKAVNRLRNYPVQVTLVDRRNFHLFQPLTYQIATGALSPGEVAYPLRAIFKSAPNVHVMLADVSGFDLDARQVLLQPVPDVPAPPSVPYDTLIVAAGSSYSYFGHDDWRQYAAEVKSMESSIKARSRILSAFERAEMTTDPATRDAEMTFVVVGAGPTGVEIAGQLGELARDTLRQEFRQIDPRKSRVLLLEAGDRVLQTFPPSLSAKAARSLEALGVTPMTNRTVTDVGATSVTTSDPDGKLEQIDTRTVIWAAGVTASGLGAVLADLAGGEVDRAGRLTVERDLTVPGHPEVIALGDMVRVRGADGNPITFPGVAPVAIQQGHYAGELVCRRLEGRPARPFHYHDKGNVATIGRGQAVVDLRLIRLSGLLAWFVWLVIHLWYLIGFQNRVVVLMRWGVSFFTHGRSARLIDAFNWSDGPGQSAPNRSGAGRRSISDGDDGGDSTTSRTSGGNGDSGSGPRPARG